MTEIKLNDQEKKLARQLSVREIFGFLSELEGESEGPDFNNFTVCDEIKNKYGLHDSVMNVLIYYIWFKNNKDGSFVELYDHRSHMQAVALDWAENDIGSPEGAMIRIKEKPLLGKQDDVRSLKQETKSLRRRVVELEISESALTAQVDRLEKTVSRLNEEMNNLIKHVRKSYK